MSHKFLRHSVERHLVKGHRRVVRLACGCVLLLFACLSQARATTIDFDDIPGGPGSRLFNQDRYQGLGVRLSIDDGVIYALDNGSSPPNTPPTTIYGSNDGGITARRPVIVQFVLPNTTTPAIVDTASFYVIDVGGPTQTGFWTAEAFDLNGMLLNSVNSNAATTQVSFSHPGSIHRVVFSPSGESELFDTLDFSPKPLLPEPGTLALAAMGLIGLYILVWRRRCTRWI
jgi:hypothetical protein